MKPSRYGLTSRQLLKLLAIAPWVIAGAVVSVLMVGSYWVGRWR